MKIVNTDMDEEPRLKRKPTTSSARPRRLSEVDIHDTKKPIPEASSFFIFSKTNRLGRRHRRTFELTELTRCYFLLNYINLEIAFFCPHRFFLNESIEGNFLSILRLSSFLNLILSDYVINIILLFSHLLANLTFIYVCLYTFINY